MMLYYYVTCKIDTYEAHVQRNMIMQGLSALVKNNSCAQHIF